MKKIVGHIRKCVMGQKIFCYCFGGGGTGAMRKNM